MVVGERRGFVDLLSVLIFSLNQSLGFACPVMRWGVAAFFILHVWKLFNPFFLFLVCNATGTSRGSLVQGGSCGGSYNTSIAKMPMPHRHVHGAFLPVILFEYPPSPSGNQWFVLLLFQKMLIMLKYLRFKYGEAGLVFFL